MVAVTLWSGRASEPESVNDDSESAGPSDRRKAGGSSWSGMGSERNTNMHGYMDSDCRGFRSYSLASKRLGTRRKSEDVGFNRNQPQQKVPLVCKNLDC